MTAAGEDQPTPGASPTRRVLITGTHTGIGHGLAAGYLQRGWQVLGTSREAPEDLVRHPSFAFQSFDLSDEFAVERGLSELLGPINHLQLVILNAGVLGQFGDLVAADADDLRRTMDINVWANRTVLNRLFQRSVHIDQVVTISSGASVNGNRGWSGYSISKAALNMLTLLYARERTDIHFCALAPGLVDTPIQDELARIEHDGRYAALDTLRQRRGTPDMPAPDVAAERLIPAIAALPTLVPSGEYADIRDERFQSVYPGG